MKNSNTVFGLTKLTLAAILVTSLLIVDIEPAEAATAPSWCAGKSYKYVPWDKLPTTAGTLIQLLGGGDLCGVKRKTWRVRLWDPKTFEKMYYIGQLHCLTLAQDIYSPRPWSYAYKMYKAAKHCRGDMPWFFVRSI